MRSILCALALLCLTTFRVQAQDDRLTTLMNEREQLVLEYQFYNQQNSSFWGKKSKKDLINILETLKKIINKDSELIGAIKVASIKKIAESTVENQREGKITVEDQRIVNARIADLQSQIKVLQVNVKKRERTIHELQEQLKSKDDLRYGKDRVIAILAGAAVLFLLYAVFLQVRLNKVHAKGKKKKVVK
ncbi:hypothetical protein [Pontibacter liquoris]|uniref:hypothetical protein n=1 Tax=Pontibacter liquoris TaxID=2905677 RepID=UPI001FA6D309|nr:hypothetical protein [Pontibacter liquoris]